MPAVPHKGGWGLVRGKVKKTEPRVHKRMGLREKRRESLTK